MASGDRVVVDFDAVGETANQLDQLKQQMSELLNKSQQTIDGLVSNGIWTGEAANKTIEAYDNFANKYFKNYELVIQNHIQFLRNSVQQGYWETETQNIGIGSQFN